MCFDYYNLIKPLKFQKNYDEGKKRKMKMEKTELGKNKTDFTRPNECRNKTCGRSAFACG